MSNIGQNLRRIREEKALSTKSVAKLFDVDEGTYISWEMGLKQPSVDEVIKITDIYGIDYTVLFDEPKVQTKAKNQTSQQPKEKSPKTQKTLLGLRISALILWLSMFGFMAMPFFGVSEYYISESGCIYDFLNAGSSPEVKFLGSLIIILLIFITIDMFLRLCFSEISNNRTYIKITNAVSIICYTGILATMIAALALPFGPFVHTNVGIVIIPIILAAELGVSIAEKVISFKNN